MLKYGIKNVTTVKPSNKATDLQIMRNLVIPKLIPESSELDQPTTQIETQQRDDDTDSSSSSSSNIQLIPESVFIHDDLGKIPDLSVRSKVKEVKIKNAPEEHGEIRDIPVFTKSKKRKKISKRLKYS